MSPTVARGRVVIAGSPCYQGVAHPWGTWNPAPVELPVAVHVSHRESPDPPPASGTDGRAGAAGATDAEHGPPQPDPAPAPEPAPPDDEFDATAHLDRVSKVVLAAVPALTVALAAVGGATGGLARLFRDQTTVARLAIGLVFLSFLLAALASRAAAGSPVSRRAGPRGLLLLLSTAAFIAGAAIAFDAQIAVMGTGQAPVVTGSVAPAAAGSTLTAHVLATGVKADRRIVIFAFESSDEHGDAASHKVPLYYSKTGPDPDGKVAVDVSAALPAADVQQYPYVFVTAVLGEEQRDCDGVLLDGRGAPAPDGTACLTLQRPGASTAASAPLTPVRQLSVPGTSSWTVSGVQLTRGQRFSVEATGAVTYTGGGPRVGPDGAPEPHPGATVLPGADHHAALIGRIGDAGTPFLVGSSFQGAAAATGLLVLGINDVGVQDNGGAFQASIDVAQR